MQTTRDKIGGIIYEKLISHDMTAKDKCPFCDKDHIHRKPVSPFSLDTIAQEILALPAEGWVVRPSWLAPNPHIQGEELAWHMNDIHDRCQPRPATIAEHLDGKAVKS